MIFGQAPQYQRLPFTRPADASFYTPRLPATAFYSTFQPFRNVLPAMAAFQTRIPSPPSHMAPGSIRWPQPGQVVAAMTPGPGMPAPGGMAGFGGFGNPFMRAGGGGFPGIMASGANMRSGVTGAGGFIRSQSPAGYPAVNFPAGTYAL